MTEKQVLLNCFKGMIEFEDRFDQVDEKQADWICERLRWHKILPMAAALNNPAKNKCQKLVSVFQETSFQNAIREKNYQKQVNKIFSAFREASIDFIPFKGPFWSKQLYPSYSWRHIGDIDLLLTKENAQAASLLLKNMGYVPDIVGNSEEEDFNIRGELALIPGPSCKNDVPVELHWELMPSPRFLEKKFLQMDDFNQNSSTDQWQGNFFRLPRPEIQFYYYALHACCQRQFSRFIHILTLAHFIQKNPLLDWDFIYKIAVEREATIPLYYSLKFIKAFFPLPRPAIILLENIIPPINVRFFAAVLSSSDILSASRNQGKSRRKLFRAAIT